MNYESQTVMALAHAYVGDPVVAATDVVFAMVSCLIHDLAFR